MSVYNYIKKKEIVELTQNLVRISSQFSEGQLREHKDMTEFLLEQLSSFGMDAEIYEGGDPGFPAVVARLRGEVGKPSICFTGHYNTVPAGDRGQWTHDPFGGEIIDGKIYGCGSNDMKGGIATVIIATKAIIDSGIKLKGDIIHLWLPGEGAQTHVLPHLIKERPELIKSDWCIDNDAGDYNLGAVFGGWIWMDINTFGLRGHPSWAIRGKPIPYVNANSKMMKLLTAMENVDDYMSYEPHQSPSGVVMPCVNVGKIEGGITVNTVPDKCTAKVDLRMVPSQTVEGALNEINMLIDKLKKEDSEEWDAEIKPFAIQHRKPGKQLSEEHLLVKEITKALQAVVPGQKPIICHSSGGGRPDLFEVMPYATFGCKRGGPVHAPNEYVEIESLVIDAKFIATLIVNKLS